MPIDSATALAFTTPETVSVKDVAKLVELLAQDDPGLKPNRLFMQGDHWQAGEGWVGPRPLQNEPGAQAALDEIARAFTSKNVIAEVCERHVQGVLGDEPGWTLVVRRELDEEEGEEPTTEEQTAIDEANALLTHWWDVRAAHGILTSVVEQVLFARRSLLRLFVPAGQAAGGGPAAAGTAPSATVSVNVATAFDAIMLVWPDTPLTEQATVYVDPDTKRSVGVLLQERDGKKRAELVYLDATQQAAAGGPSGEEADVSQASAVFNTTIRVISEAEGAGEATISLPLGGRLPMFEIVRKPLISEQMRQAQKALNLALSMVPRNVITGGFLERILTNAQIPGEFKRDANGVEHFVPNTPRFGAGSSAWITGLETEDEVSGKKVLATPGVHHRDPVPVTSSVEAKKTHYEDMLDEADQRHVLMGSDATDSGYSREQARADFEQSLKATNTLLVPLGRWLLETVLAYAEALLNEPGRWTNLLRVEFRPFINTGPPSAEEQTVNNASVAAGTLSLETALQRGGITDVEAEMARINDQPAARLAIMEKQAAILNILFGMGLPPDVAGEMVGMTSEEIALLKKAIVDEPDDPDGRGAEDDAEEPPPRGKKKAPPPRA